MHKLQYQIYLYIYYFLFYVFVYLFIHLCILFRLQLIFFVCYIMVTIIFVLVIFRL